MSDNDYVFKDRHNNCLCPDGLEEFEIVTTETREGSGLWVQCIKCNLVLNRTGFSKEELTDFYNEDYQKSNSFKRGSVITPREHYELAMHSMRPVAEHLEKYLKPFWDVVDIGAATGEFLDLIKDRVNSCLGIELNREYCDFIRDELDIEATSEDYFEVNYEQKFDLAVINATLDHMYNPLGVLDKIYRDLKPGGMIYIQTVNDNQALKECLPHQSREMFKRFMYQRAHYLSFNETTLRHAFEQSGFQIIDLHSRHDYTLNNFLNWYYTGQPQNSIFSSKVDDCLFPNSDIFSRQMNELMRDSDRKFREIIEKNKRGELLCLTAIKPKQK